MTRLAQHLMFNTISLTYKVFFFHCFFRICFSFSFVVEILKISVDFFSRSVIFQIKLVVFCDNVVFLHNNANIKKYKEKTMECVTKCSIV